MINFAHMTHGDALTNTTLSRTLPGAFTSAFNLRMDAAAVPGHRRVDLLGRPRALPL